MPITKTSKKKTKKKLFEIDDFLKGVHRLHRKTSAFKKVVLKSDSKTYRFGV